MKKYFFTRLLAALVSLLTLTTINVNAQLTPTLTSDQPDYAPLSTATFHGSGFAAGEDVILKVKNLFQPCNTINPDSSYLPWTVTADPSGSFVTTWTVCNCPGDSLRLRATGVSSGAIAYLYFADAATDVFRTVTSGNWNSNSTWEYQVGGVGAFIPATFTPTAALAATTTIRSGHTVTVTAGVTVDQVVVEAGGQLNVNPGITLTTSNGTGIELTVNGTVSVSGTLTQGGTTTTDVNGDFIITSTGLVNGNGGNGATRPIFTINSGGDLTIAAGGAWTTGGSGPAILTFSTGSTGTLNGNVTGSNDLTINGTVSSDGLITAGNTTQIGGSLTKTGGAISGMTGLTIDGTVTSSANITLVSISNLLINGNLTMNAGIITLTRGNGGAVGSVSSGAVLTLNGTSKITIGTVATANFTVATGGTLEMGPNAIVDGTGYLNVGNCPPYNPGGTPCAGANLKIGSVDGIVNSTTLGNVRTTAADIFRTDANYFYNGTGAQSTGNALPLTVNNLTIENTVGAVTPTNNITTNGTLNVSANATLQKMGTFTLTIGAGGVSNAGTIELNGNTAACPETDLISVQSTIAGTQRLWSGAGVFNFIDVSIQDQAGTALITVLSGTDAGNNAANWTFNANCVASSTITATAGPNGTVSPAGATAVPSGGSQAYTITADPCYHILDVLVDGVSDAGAISSGTYTFTNVITDHTISATFAINTFTITSSAGANGSISPAGATVVNCGGSQGYTISPASSCYEIASVLVDGINDPAAVSAGSYTFSNVTANHTISATFVLKSFTITASAGANGTVTPVGPSSVNCGADKTYTITADPCYQVATVLVDGVNDPGAVTSGSYTFTNVTATHTISATFSPRTYTINASSGANGSVTPNGATVVNCGGSQAYTIAPASSCYQIADVLVDGSSVGAVGTYTFNNVTANHTISASFSLKTFTVTASSGANGSVTPNGATVVNCGGSQAYTIAPASSCYQIADVLVDGSSVGAVGTYTFNNVTANHTISASFSLKTFTVTASSGANGSVTPNGVTIVNCGAALTYTITANACYEIADVLVDGVSVGAVGTYTFNNVTANHTITASFMIASYTITASSGSNGSVVPAAGTAVNCGGSQTYTITADACYEIAAVLVDGVNNAAAVSSGTYSFTNIQADHTISATFALRTYSINASAGANGSIVPNGGSTVNCGSNKTYSITANACYYIADVLVDGVSVGAVGSYTFTNVQANHTIAASFANYTYNITASAGANGSVTPAGTTAVICGTNKTYAITANGCYHVEDVLVDGSSVGAVTSYTFNNVTAAHTISATFAVNTVSVDASASSAPVPVNTAITLKATVSPAIAGITVSFYLDAGLTPVCTGVTNTSGYASCSIGNLPSEVYKVTAVAGAGCASSIAYLAVYDPNGGFVTGGGWYNSPPGAYYADITLVGKANFGFVSKYKKGSTVPEGNTEFQFQAGSLNFTSSSYNAGSLVVASYKAIYKGVGKINGLGNFGFMVSAIDGQITGGGGADKFRIKIWDKNNGDAIVYDNGLGADETTLPPTTLGGGSIVIHEAKGNGNNLVRGVEETIEVAADVKPDEDKPFKVLVSPNPSTTSFKMMVESITKDPVHIRIFNAAGNLVKVIPNASRNTVISIGDNLRGGNYFAEVIQGLNRKTVKLVKTN